jgi:hypothetical protein
MKIVRFYNSFRSIKNKTHRQCQKNPLYAISIILANHIPRFQIVMFKLPMSLFTYIKFFPVKCTAIQTKNRRPPAK